MEFVIKIYDDHGRLKLPARILKELKLRKNSLLRVIVDDNKIIMIPIKGLWPKKGNINEDDTLINKHLAWYEV